jgi:hypothetical protein
VNTPNANRDGSWMQMLKATPVRNTAARVVENSDYCITVHVKQRRPGYMVPPLSWIVPFSRERRVTLDAIGTKIWHWCDGVRTVEEVADRFKEQYQLTFHEARAAVTGYLKMLLKRGVLAIVMQDEE